MSESLSRGLSNEDLFKRYIELAELGENFTEREKQVIGALQVLLEAAGVSQEDLVVFLKQQLKSGEPIPHGDELSRRIKAQEAFTVLVNAEIPR